MPIIQIDKNIMAMMGMFPDATQQKVKSYIFDQLFTAEPCESENPYANVLLDSVKSAVNGMNVAGQEYGVVPECDPKRESTLLYQSHIQSLRSLSDADFGKCMKQLCDYAFFGIEPDKEHMPAEFACVWGIMKASMDTAHKKYDACVANGKKGAEHGKKGGRPRRNQSENDDKNPNEKPQTITPVDNPNDKPLSVSDSVSDSVSSLPLKANEDKENLNKREIGSVSLDETDPKNENGEKDDRIAPPDKADVVNFFVGIGKTEQAADKFYQYNAERNWQALRSKNWTTLADEWKDYAGNDSNDQGNESNNGVLTYEQFVSKVPDWWKKDEKPVLMNHRHKMEQRSMRDWYRYYTSQKSAGINFFDEFEQEEVCRRKYYENLKLEEEERKRVEEHFEF